MKRTLCLVLTILIALSSFSCGQTEEPPEKLGGIRTDQGDLYPDEFLVFNSESISFDEFRYYYLNYRDMYLSEDPAYFSREGAEEDLKQEILQCLLDSWAVRFLAKEHKVSLTKKEKKAVQSDIETIKGSFESEEAFLSSLHASYMSRQLYTSMMEYSALYLKLFNTLFEDGGKLSWSTEQFYSYYREHYFAVQQIYLPYAEGESAKTCDATRAKADAILAEAGSGKDFWELVEQYGNDRNMLSYPDGYYITEGEAEQVLYEALRALQIGQISQPVCGETGVYLLKRVELKERYMDENRQTALFGYTDSLDEWHNGAYDEVFQTLYREKANTIQVQYQSAWDLISTETVF